MDAGNEGKDRRSTLAAAAAASLANTHSDQGTRLRGEDRPHTLLHAATSPVNTCGGEGKLGAAEDMHAKVLAASTRVPGEGHPHMLSHADYLGAVLLLQGCRAAAAPLLHATTDKHAAVALHATTDKHAAVAGDARQPPAAAARLSRSLRDTCARLHRVPSTPATRARCRHAGEHGQRGTAAAGGARGAGGAPPQPRWHTADGAAAGCHDVRAEAAAPHTGVRRGGGS